MNAQQASVADLARLNFLLAELYAEAVLGHPTQVSHSKAELIGCHGQTLYHQGERPRYSWAATRRHLADRRRRGDRGARRRPGGLRFPSRRHGCRRQGRAAGSLPRLPALSRSAHRPHRAEHRRHRKPDGDSGGRVAEQVTAFDTGPGNMVIDAVTERLFGKPYDRDGRIAASGAVLEPWSPTSLRQPFFQPQASQDRRPRRIRPRVCASNSSSAADELRKPDVVATATALTARSIADAMRRLRAAASRKSFASSSFPAAAPTIPRCSPCWPTNFKPLGPDHSPLRRIRTCPPKPRKPPPSR